MWMKPSLCFELATVVLFLSIHQGLTDGSDCRLVLSETNSSLAIRVGSTGELMCQISSQCNMVRKRVLGPFWKQPDGKWFIPNLRMDNLRINSTTISLRYTRISPRDLGTYICVARIGRKKISIAANITERKGKPGDINVTAGPEGSTKIPRKKRSAEDSLKSFAGVGLVRAAPSMNGRRLARRSVPGKTKNYHHANLPVADDFSAGNRRFRPVKTECNEEKLFSKTGIIIVIVLVCSTFLLLYMVILLMAVPRICFPYYPKKKREQYNRSAESGQNKDRTSTKVDIPLSRKVRHNGRSDSGIESVDGLEEKGSHHGGERTESHWEIAPDKLEEFYRRTTNQKAGSDEDMLSGLKIYNFEKNMPRRGRSESVPVTPYRYQSSIYVKV